MKKLESVLNTEENTIQAKYFAVSAKGIEQFTAQELLALGASDVEVVPGGVFFTGSKEVLYKANLWLRTATRVLKELRNFAAKTPEMLYDQVRRIRWEDFLSLDKTFSIQTHIHKSHAIKCPNLGHSHFASLKIKDAIADQMRQKQGSRPSVNTASPDFTIYAYFHDGRCTLSLDSSGKSLHERGYRVERGQAPLKETLAAAIIMATEWDKKTSFIDPMCGSGTIVIEAGLMACNIAPGSLRKHFGFMSWPDYDAKLWEQIQQDAKSQVKTTNVPHIFGCDYSLNIVESARENIRKAGLANIVAIKKQKATIVEPGAPTGVMVCNPPYGERLGEAERLKVFYKNMGDYFKQKMKGWTVFVFTGNLELSKSVGLRTSKRIPLYNGAIECRLLRYEMH